MLWLSEFGTRVLITKLYRQKALLYEIMTMKMFATLDKAKPNIGNIRGLNLAAVKRRAVQMSNCLCKEFRGR